MTPVTAVMFADVSEKRTSGSTSKRNKEPIRSRRQTWRRIWSLLHCLAFDPVPPNCRWTSTGLYGVTCYTTIFFTIRIAKNICLYIPSKFPASLCINFQESRSDVFPHRNSARPFNCLNLLQLHWFNYPKSIRGNLRLPIWWHFGMWAFWLWHRVVW